MKDWIAMPSYNVKNKKTGKITEIFMGISEMEQYKLDHPNVEILCGAPLIHSGAGLGLRSMRGDQHFKDKLKAIDKANPGNTLNQFAKFKKTNKINIPCLDNCKVKNV